MSTFHFEVEALHVSVQGLCSPLVEIFLFGNHKYLTDKLVLHWVYWRYCSFLYQLLYFFLYFIGCTPEDLNATLGVEIAVLVWTPALIGILVLCPISRGPL